MDEAADKIFEMVKSKINEPKKKKRTRTYTPKQMEAMKRNLAKGRAVLKARRDAKKSQNIKLEIKPVKQEPKVKQQVVKEVAKPPSPKPQSKPPSPKQEQHQAPKPRAPQFNVTPVLEESYNINFSEGGSLW